MITRRLRILAHACHSISAQPKKSRRLPTTLSLNEYILSNRRIFLHGIHPRQSPESEKDQLSQWPGFTPPRDSTTPPLPGLLSHRRLHIDMFGSGAPIEDRLPFVITNTFSTSPGKLNKFRVFVFFASPALSIQEHNATYDHMVYLLNEKGWTNQQLGLDTATRSPVLSCHLPGINIDHPTYAFFETHNTRTREIQQFGLHPFLCISSETEERFSSTVDDAVFGTLPQEQIDQIKN